MYVDGIGKIYTGNLTYIVLCELVENRTKNVKFYFKAFVVHLRTTFSRLTSATQILNYFTYDEVKKVKVTKTKTHINNQQ